MAQYDWIAAGINHTDYSLNDYVLAGFNTENTQLLSADEYKKSNYIREKFSKNGQFDENAFDNFYRNKVAEYDQLTGFGDDYDSFIYSWTDTAGKGKPNVETPTFQMQMIANPTRQTVTLMDEVYDSGLSMRELAQKNKIYNSTTGKWSEDTLNDRSFTSSPKNWFKTAFGEPLVYATYQEDGTHVDQYTGQEVQHYKGQYKLNQYGLPYTETLGNQSMIGREVVSAFDYLTVDGEGIDKYNFFDSDDLEKSVAGTVAKAAVSIAPLFMGPVVSAIYNGALIAKGLLTTLPMLYGMTTSFTDLPKENSFLNSLAARSETFTTSTSDKGRSSILNAEVLGTLISDVALQWGQQRLIAQSVSKLRGAQNIQEEAMKRAALTYEAQKMQLKKQVEKELITEQKYAQLIGDPENWTQSVLGKAAIEKYTKDIQDIVKRSNRVGADASLAYMALISNTDVYESMLEAGASKKEAAAVALGSTVGMFGVDRYLHLGEMFFDDLTTEYENQLRRTLCKGVGTWYDSFKQQAPMQTQSKLRGLVSKGVEWGRKKTNEFVEDLQYHTTGFFGKALGEGLEEVSEEIVSDLSKQLYELAGELGADTSTKDVGAFDNWAARYGMSFLGGALGGGIFYGVDVYNKGSFHIDQTQDELIYLVRNGKTKEVLDTLKKWRDKGKLGSTKLSFRTQTDSKGNNVFITATNPSDTQNEFVYNRLKETVEQLDAIIGEYNADLSEEELYNNMILRETRFQELQKYLQGQSYTIGYQQDYQRVLNNLVNAKAAYNKALQTLDGNIASEPATDEQLRGMTEEERKQKKKNLSKLEDDIKLAEETLQKFLSGEYSLDYVDKLLFSLNPALHGQFVAMTYEEWLKKEHGGKKPEELTLAEQKQFKQDYLAYKKVQQKVDLDEQYRIFKAVQKTIDPALKEIQESNFSETQDAILEVLEEIKTFRTYNENDVLDFRGETKDSDSYKNRGEREIRIDRIKAINEENEKRVNDLYDKIISTIDKSGGKIDPLTRRQIRLNLLARNSVQVKGIIQDTINSIKANQEEETKLDNDIIELLKTIPTENIDSDGWKQSIEKIISQINERIVEEFQKNVRENNAPIAALQNALYDENFDQELTGGNLKRFIDGAVKYRLKKEIPVNPTEDEKKEIADAVNSLSKDIQSHINEKYANDAISLLNTILYRYNEGTLDDNYKIERKKGITDVSQDQDALQKSDYYRRKINDILEGIENDRIINLNRELDKRVADINPITSLVKKAALSLNLPVKNIEKVLDMLDKQFQAGDLILDENGRAIIDFTLSTEDKETLDEAMHILDLLNAYIYAASDIESVITPWGHNVTINNFAKKHKDIFKDFEELATLPKDVGAMYSIEFARYQEQIGKYDEKTGEYSPRSYRWFSAKNEINKAAQHIRTDRAWNTAVYDFFKNNCAAFRFTFGNTQYDLLEGFDAVPVVTKETQDGGVHIAKLFKILYDNTKKLTNKGWTYTQLWERSGILEKVVGNEVLYQKTSKLNENLTSDQLTSYDRVILLSTIIAMDPVKFYQFLQTRIEQTNDIVPLTVQEWLSRIGIAFYENRDAFTQTMAYAIKKQNDKNGKNDPRAFLSNSYLCAGDAGGGKSVVIAANIAAYTETDDIWLSAPTHTQTNTLFNAVGKKGRKFTTVGDSTRNLDSLLETIGVDMKVYNRAVEALNKSDSSDLYTDKNAKDTGGEYGCVVITDFDKFGLPKSIANPPKLIIIDEATHLNSVALQLINEFARRNGATVLLLGDVKQDGYQGKGLNVDREYITMLRSPELNLSLRDNNIQHQSNLQTISRIIQEFNDSDSEDPNYNSTMANLVSRIHSICPKVYKEDEINGDLITTELTDDIVKLISKDMTVGFIGDKTSSNYTMLENAGLDVTVFEDEKTIQGQEFDIVIIDKKWSEPKNKPASWYFFLKNYYTMISRGRNGSVIIDGDNKIQDMIGQNRIETVKAKAPKIIIYTEQFKKEKLGQIKTILQQNSSGTTTTTTTTTITKDDNSKTPLQVKKSNFNIDHLKVKDNKYLAIFVTKDQAAEAIQNGVTKELWKKGTILKKDDFKKDLNTLDDERNADNAYILIKLSNSEFKDATFEEGKSPKDDDIKFDNDTIPSQYIDYVIYSEARHSKPSYDIDPEDDTITNPNEVKQVFHSMRFDIGNWLDEAIVTDKDGGNPTFPMLCYGHVTFTGLNREIRERKEIWINNYNGGVKRDAQIFLKETGEVSGDKHIELSNRIRTLKQYFLYRGNQDSFRYSDLPKDIKDIVSEEALKNTKWRIEVRERNNQDNFIRNTGFKESDMGIGSQKLVYAIVGRFKLKDGDEADITWGLMSSPETYTKNVENIKKNLQNRKSKLDKDLNDFRKGISNEKRAQMQEEIAHINEKIDKVDIESKQYNDYIEELAGMYKGQPIIVNISTPIFPGLTNLHKRGTPIRLSSLTKARIKKLKERVDQLEHSKQNITNQKIIEQIDKSIEQTNEKITALLKEAAEESWERFNPYTVRSDMYIYVDSAQDIVDKSLMGKYNVIFVTNDISLKKEDLLEAYYNQKTQQKSRQSLMEGDAPRVRMVILNPVGVSIQDMGNPYMIDVMKSEILNKKTNKSVKRIYPFKSGYTGIRMYVGMWNFRANITNFKREVENLKKELKIADDVFDKYLTLKDLQWRKNNNDDEHKLSKDEETYLSQNSQILTKQDFINFCKRIDDFNNSLANKVKEFRLGGGFKNGAYVGQLKGDLSALYREQENRKQKNGEQKRIYGIYINLKTLEKYSSFINTLFDDILDNIIECKYDKEKLLTNKDGYTNSFKGYVADVVRKGEKTITMTSFAFNENTQEFEEKEVEVTFDSSYDKERRIENSFSHVPVLMSKILQYANMYSRNETNIDDFKKFHKLKITSVIKENGKDSPLNIELNYSNFLREVSKGNLLDDDASNFFSFMFHGSLEDVNERKHIRATDAFFPKGFFSDPLGTTDTKQKYGFKKAVQQPWYFSANVDIGDPTFYVTLSDFKKGIDEVKKGPIEQKKTIDRDAIRQKYTEFGLLTGFNEIFENDDIDNDDNMTDYIKEAIERDLDQLLNTTSNNVSKSTILDIDGTHAVTIPSLLAKEGIPNDIISVSVADGKFNVTTYNGTYEISRDIYNNWQIEKTGNGINDNYKTYATSLVNNSNISDDIKEQIIKEINNSEDADSLASELSDIAYNSAEYGNEIMNICSEIMDRYCQ